jgi:stage II sporulation protein B
MEVNIGKKVHSADINDKKHKEAFQPKVKVQTKKIGKSNTKTKIKPRVIPFPIEEDKRDVIDWSSPGKPFAREKKDQQTFVHLFISIAGALLVGTVMGFSVLTLFFSDRPNSNHNSIDAHLQRQTEKKPSVQNPAEQNPVSSIPESMSLPSLQVSFLQAGNYQSKSSATKVAEQYRTKGFAAVMSDQAPFRIFLGVAANKANAQQLSKRYAAKGITVYVKTQTLAGKGPKMEGLLETLSIGNQLYSQLEAISVKSITKSKKIQIPNNLKEKQVAFMKANQKSNAYPTETRAAMMELARGLDQAVQGAIELSKHQNATLGWFIQEGLVRYTTGYEHLLYSLKGNK